LALVALLLLASASADEEPQAPVEYLAGWGTELGIAIAFEMADDTEDDAAVAAGFGASLAVAATDGAAHSAANAQGVADEAVRTCFEPQLARVDEAGRDHVAVEPGAGGLAGACATARDGALGDAGVQLDQLAPLELWLDASAPSLGTWGSLAL
jgi:hypothetical protein